MFSNNGEYKLCTLICTHCEPMFIPSYNAGPKRTRTSSSTSRQTLAFCVAPFWRTVGFIILLFKRFVYCLASPESKVCGLHYVLNEKCTWRVLLGVRKGSVGVRLCLLWTSRRTWKTTWRLKSTSPATWKPPSPAAILSVGRLCTNPSLVFDNGKIGF